MGGICSSLLHVVSTGSLTACPQPRLVQRVWSPLRGVSGLGNVGGSRDGEEMALAITDLQELRGKREVHTREAPHTLNKSRKQQGPQAIQARTGFFGHIRTRVKTRQKY